MTRDDKNQTEGPNGPQPEADHPQEIDKAHARPAAEQTYPAWSSVLTLAVLFALGGSLAYWALA